MVAEQVEILRRELIEVRKKIAEYESMATQAAIGS